MSETDRLSPCGESGLKCVLHLNIHTAGVRLSPCGESGLKSASAAISYCSMSLSPCGESGLKFKLRAGKGLRAVRLSPCGESGLKSRGTRSPAPAPAGLSPCGESGLKYQRGKFLVVGHASLPMRGEWIEIFSGSFPSTFGLCLSPCGESGLKSFGRRPCW